MLKTKSRYQLIEVNVQIIPSRLIPRTRLKPGGTNAGMNATAITAALALVRLVVIPVLNGVGLINLSMFEKSNLELFLNN